MKKNKIGGNKNRSKLFNSNQHDRFNQGDVYKTFITSKIHHLRIIHKRHLKSNNIDIFAIQ